MKSALNEKPKVLAIIPARGGSKGLPRKNIKLLYGKPLITYSIEVALQAELIDQVLVSTDDEEIASVARNAGADVPFLRPLGLADDKANVGDAVHFTLTELAKRDINPKIVILLYPTHPFRTPKLLNFIVSKNLDGFTPVQTVKKITLSNCSLLVQNNLGKLYSVLPTNFDGRLKRKTFFRDYGLCTGFLLGAPSKPFIHTIENPVSLIDIDSPHDFFLSEEVLKNNLFDFATAPF